MCVALCVYWRLVSTTVLDQVPKIIRFHSITAISTRLRDHLETNLLCSRAAREGTSPSASSSATGQLRLRLLMSDSPSLTEQRTQLKERIDRLTKASKIVHSLIG